MKTVLFSGSSDLAAVYTMLQQQDRFYALVVPARHAPGALPVIAHIENAGHQVVMVDDTAEKWVFLEEWYGRNDIDITIAYSFPYKVPSSILSMSRLGAYNVHFSLLPAYRGPVPLFWQLKNKEQRTGVTIHTMTQRVDKGAIALQQDTAILPGETYGLLASRLRGMAMQMLQQLITGIHAISLQEQVGDGSYYGHPGKKDISVDWDIQTAQDIECLVNACNPAYGGAMTAIKGMQVRLVEVAQADMPGMATDTRPGTIVYADAQHGMFVNCYGAGILKVNVLQIEEGIYSGSKLASLGLSDLQFN